MIAARILGVVRVTLFGSVHSWSLLNGLSASLLSPGHWHSGAPASVWKRAPDLFLPWRTITYQTGSQSYPYCVQQSFFFYLKKLWSLVEKWSSTVFFFLFYFPFGSDSTVQYCYYNPFFFRHKTTSRSCFVRDVGVSFAIDASTRH